MEKDTICALSTPYGISGIALIRLSGPDTFAIIKEIFKPARKRKIPEKWETHTVRYGHIVDGEKIIDEVLVTIMKSPATYTREDMAEIGCHGGLAAVKSVLSLCLRKGARLAEPGEFTKRAFLNGRIDLAQAESVLEIINAKTEKSLEISISQLSGALSKKISELRKKLMDMLVMLDYEIDFSHDYGDIQENDISRKIEQITEEMKNVLNTGQAGRIFTEGVKIAIVGKPNVGKSSLLNLLVEEEKAIVSDIPGTTRDSIEAVININGIPFTIVDTAGIRHHTSEIEEKGVERARKWMEKAEIVIVVLDSSTLLEEIDYQILAQVKKKCHIIVFNKCDLQSRIDNGYLPGEFQHSKIVKLSCVTQYGLKDLYSAILEKLYEGHCEISNTNFFLNIRQQESLKKSIETLEETRNLICDGKSIDIIAEMLKYAITHLDEITGKNISEQVLNEIFSRFCIGK